MRRNVLALLILSFWAGCSPKSPAAGSRALVWARSADSTTLDPPEVESLEDMKVTQSLYETLVAFRDGSVEIEGRLAERWSLSPDGRTATFELRRGVKFHDGTPFDADAVAFSLRRVLDPNHPCRPRAVPYPQRNRRTAA